MPTIPAIPAGEPNELLGGNRFDCRQRKWVPQVLYSTYTLYYCIHPLLLYIHPLLLYSTYTLYYCTQRKWAPQVLYSTYTLYYCTV